MATFSEVSSDYGVDEELSRDLQALREILENEEQPLQPGKFMTTSCTTLRTCYSWRQNTTETHKHFVI